MKNKLLVVVTLVVLLCGLAACYSMDPSINFDFDESLQKCDVSKTAKFQSDGATVKIDTDVYGVAVRQEDVEQIKLDYVKSNGFSFEFSEKEGELYIGVICNDPVKQAKQDLYLLVRVPKDWTNCNYEVNTKTGDNLFFDVIAKEISLTTNTGAFALSKCEAEVLNIKNNTGSVSFDGEYEQVDVRVNTGSVNCSATVKSATTIQVDTGSIDFSLNCPVVNAKTDTGSIHGKIKGAKADYAVSTYTSLGTSNLTNKSGDGKHSLTVSTSTGSINVVFDN